jgi:hypothetical protein
MQRIGWRIAMDGEGEVEGGDGWTVDGQTGRQLVVV